jgi:hypothetical protein
VVKVARSSGGATDQRVFVAQHNIEYFREKLITETDEDNRRVLIKLLAEEETKSAVLTDPSNENQAG